MRFSLQSLLLAFVVFWSSLAAFDLWGFLVAVFILAAVGCIRDAKSKREAALGTLVIFVVFGCLLGLLLPAVQSSHDSSARQATCMSNLRQIALALHAYHNVNGCFPPAYVADKTGKPMHSWRVLLLPYLGQEDLYQQYDFQEPWDGPNNSTLGKARPSLYVCRSSVDAGVRGSMTTSYLAVVGPETAWPGAETRRLQDIRDGTRQTIILVEADDSGIHWMEPKDLAFEQAGGGINPTSTPGISGRHRQDRGDFRPDVAMVTVAFADATVSLLTEDIPPETVEALLTIDGGEDVDMDKRPTTGRRSNWTRIIGLVVLALSVALLLFRPKKRDQV